MRRRFGCQLAPVFPFFLVNLLMPLTPIRAASFHLTSQIGVEPPSNRSEPGGVLVVLLEVGTHQRRLPPRRRRRGRGSRGMGSPS